MKDFIGLVFILMVVSCWVYICNVNQGQKALDIRLKHLEELIYDNNVEDSKIGIS